MSQPLIQHQISDARRSRAPTMISTTSSFTAKSTGSSTESTSSTNASSATNNLPLLTSNGRTWLKESPLPLDLREVNRQGLRFLTLMNVFGEVPFCNPFFNDFPPMRVLEVACGAAMWSHACHKYFARRGHNNIAFYGIDVVNISPDLTRQGVNWRFFRHDIHSQTAKPPFPDNYFDFIFLKDISLATSITNEYLEKWTSLLRPGGVIELWESEHIFRTLLPNPPPAPGLSPADYEHARRTGTYLISPSTPWAETRNPRLKEYNTWVDEAFEKLKIHPMPCARMGVIFNAEEDILEVIGSKKIALPLGVMEWETNSTQQQEQQQQQQQQSITSDNNNNSNSNRPQSTGGLTKEQLGLRKTTLLTVLYMIEGMEHVLTKTAGKATDEWDKWWSDLSADMTSGNGLAGGECLEVGAWWGRKR